MLIKEAIQKVAQELKRDQKIDLQDPTILEGYSEDLSEDDIRQALKAISIVYSKLISLAASSKLLPSFFHSSPSNLKIHPFNFDFLP